MKTLLISALFLLIGTATVFAAVPELDDCRDARECHLYCDIPANKPACWAYGQSKVLGDATVSATPVFPIALLGNCANKTECRAYCEVAEHRLACVEFARLHHLGKLHPAAALIEKAKTELGCDTLPACRAICEQAVNKDKCRSFTLKFAPQQIRDRVSQAEDFVLAAQKALSCTSKEACVLFCKVPSNRNQCEAFFRSRLGEAKPATGSGELQLLREKLKANCNSAEECRSWCVAHPGLCPGFTNPVNFR